MIMSSADTIKKMRLGLCLEQEQLAHELGITTSAISNYERGVRTPRLRIIKKMLDLAKKNGLDLSVENFLN